VGLNNSQPVNAIEFAYAIINYVLGVCMFAVIVGNVGLIITSMDEEHSAFYNIVDKTKKFMLKKEIPQDTQDRVKRWYGIIYAVYIYSFHL